jgi:hypothetical protein
MEFGSHALTLDHVGAYLAEFCDGEPAAATRLDEPRLDSDTPEERKLARVLRAYEKALSPRELDLLVRFCLFRTGVSTEVLHSVFSRADAPKLCGNLAGCAEAEFRRIVTRLARLHLLLPEPGGGHTAHPAIRDHFYRTFTHAATAHRTIGRKLMSDYCLDITEEWGQVSKGRLMGVQERFLHRFNNLNFKIDRLNSYNFSEWLRGFLSRHGLRLSRECAGQIHGCVRALESESEVIDLPDLVFTDGKSYTYRDLLVSWRNWHYRFQNWSSGGEWDTFEHSHSWRKEHFLSWSTIDKEGSRQPHEEWLFLHEYKDVLDARKKLTDQLREFLSRHGQRLSRACTGQIHGCIRVLEDGSKDFELPDLEPDIPGVTLHLRPGPAKPEDPFLLDALEEVIYHTVHSGNERDAYELYSRRLGGREHLGKAIGEYARGVRILRYFRACPNDLDLAWYLRGVGDLRASFDLLSDVRPIWSSTVLCLQGFLPRVLRDKVGWEHSRVVAAFLLGRPDAFDPGFDLGWGEALVNADLPLMRGELARARAVAASDLKNFGNGTTHVPEQVRTRLVLAEIERREGHAEMALAALEGEAPWIFRSGSVEHLGLYHLIRSRVLTDQGQYEAANSESREGMLLTRQCGLGLAHVDFLNLRSRIALARTRSIPDQSAPERETFLEAAARSALGALNGIRTEDGAPASRPDMPLGDLIAFGALHPECQYAWGAADAIALLGEILADQRQPDLPRDALRRASDLQSTLQHPDLARTEELLSRLERKRKRGHS